MDESPRREAQAVVETSYDEKVSGTCKSEQLEEVRERGEEEERVSLLGRLSTATAA